MKLRNSSSRSRFAEYRRQLRQRRRNGQGPDANGRAKDAAPRSHRSAWVLVRQFLSLLSGHRLSMTIALATLTVSTLLKLVPPAATKLVVDYVFPGKPLPLAEGWHLPAAGMPLLTLLAVGVFAVSLLSLAINTWGRYLATVTTKRAGRTCAGAPLSMRCGCRCIGFTRSSPAAWPASCARTPAASAISSSACFTTLGARDSAIGQPGGAGLGRLAIAARLAAGDPHGLLHASHVDWADPAAIPRDSPPAPGNRQPRDRSLWRHARVRAFGRSRSETSRFAAAVI